MTTKRRKERGGLCEEAAVSRMPSVEKNAGGKGCLTNGKRDNTKLDNERQREEDQHAGMQERRGGRKLDDAALAGRRASPSCHSNTFVMDHRN